MDLVGMLGSHLPKEGVTLELSSWNLGRLAENVTPGTKITVTVKPANFLPLPRPDYNEILAKINEGLVIDSGSKIKAILALRQEVSLGLREAKEAVEAYIEQRDASSAD